VRCGVLRILLVTGRLGEATLRRAIERSNSKHHVDVLVLPIEVAALLTPELLKHYLSQIPGLSLRYDIVIAPGLVRGSLKGVSEDLGVPIVKGTIHADDVDTLLRLNEGDLVMLSPERPADEVLAERELRICLSSVEERSQSIPWVPLGDKRVYVDPPPILLVAEVVGVSASSYEKLVEKAQSYIEVGAEAIAIAPSRDVDPSELARIIKGFSVVGVPLGLDTPRPKLVRRAMKAGIDFVLNVTSDLIRYLDGMPKEVTLVLTAGIDHSNGVEELIERVFNMGFENVIVDPVIDPPLRGTGFIVSLERYRSVRSRWRTLPLAANVNNIVEYVDADSTGVIGFLLPLLLELGVGMVVAMELGAKSYGIVEEVSTGILMATCASIRGGAPTGFAPNLLVLKERRWIDIVLGRVDRVVEAQGFRRPAPDPAGLFKVRIRRDESLIEVLHIGRRGRVLIRGRDAASIYQKAIELGLVSTLDHAAYLGQELAKAEEALRTGKNYVQDRPLFTRPGELLRAFLGRRLTTQAPS